MNQNYTSYKNPHPDPYQQNFAYSSQQVLPYQENLVPGARPYVNPIQAIKNWFKYMFHFSGRASRSEFWWVVLAWIVFDRIFDFTIDLIMGFLTNIGDLPKEVYLTLVMSWSFINICILVFSFVSMIALNWRRLHDVNVSGKCFLLVFIPLLGLIPLIYCIWASNPEGVRFDAPDDATRP